MIYNRILNCVRNELFFFERVDFSEYLEQKKKEGFIIESITKYLNDNSLIQDIDIFEKTIDITALSAYVFNNNVQYIAEGGEISKVVRI